ncbi:MAG: DUF393 domain-containing protein [Planctomycetota bacterium]|nr:DUF393 domain-containing protein [Planctomycetota bacterium]
MNPSSHWLLYDGDCGFCRRCIDFCRRLDSKNRFRIVAYQNTPPPPLSPALREACNRSIHVIDSEGNLYSSGRATLFILSTLGWTRLAKILGRRPLYWSVEFGYQTVARHRALVSRLLRFPRNKP